MHLGRINKEAEVNANTGETPAPPKDKTIKKDDFSKFAILDNWRESMIAYIEDESGNFIVTDKQWLSLFYDYEAY